MDERTKLLAIVQSRSAPLEERVRCGDELGRLGDERATRIDRVRVEGGAFPFSRGNRAEPRMVTVSAFDIDRHPVTVAAFAEFIAAGGYRRQVFWSRRGWSWRTRENIEAPRFWGEAEWAAYLVPNHPVVGVSVYEAEAYARFLGARLPTEAEWEKACRGTSGRAYPWGDAWQPDVCGRRDFGPRSTVPIGVFSGGVTPEGVAELVGCVWQWCADAADEDAEVDDVDPFVDPEAYDETTQRVARGGAWNVLEWNLTCGSRNAFPPTARFSNLGFRTAK